MKLNGKIDELKDELIKSSQELIGIRSIQGEAEDGMPFGREVAKALSYALDMSSKMGFKTVNLDGYIGYAEYGEGDEYVGVLGHLDVVPEGDGWIYPPYEAQIHEGKMYGRGTLDDKAPMVAALYGLKAIKDLNLPLYKKVRIIFGTNEESGCKEIPYYTKREIAPVSGFTPDGQYPIIFAEKGITIFDVVKDLKVKVAGSCAIKYIKGGKRANMVPDYCEAAVASEDVDLVIKSCSEFAAKTGYKISAQIKDGIAVIKSVGVSAHGSTPQFGKNAIMQMFKFLAALNLGKCDIGEFIDFFNKYISFETDGTSFGVGLSDKVSGKLSFNVGTIIMNESKVTVTLNLRYPVTMKYEDMMTPFEKRLEGAGIKVENMMHQAPLYFPSDHPLITTLQRVYTEQTGLEAKLLAIGGGTYAKEIPNIVAFGPILPGKPDLDHQANEYIEIEDLIINAKIYAHAIYELAK